jgi:hypothetical protein
MTTELDAIVRELNVLMLVGTAMFLWFIGWRRYRLDVFRQNVFALRDELFDIAADGDIQFKDQAYGGLRRHLNATIRYGHRLNSTNVIAYQLFGPKLPVEFRSGYDVWRESVNQISDADVRARLLNIHERLVYQIVLKIAVTSVLMLLTLGVMLSVMMAVVGAKQVVALVARLGEKFPGLNAIEEELDLAA